MPRPLSPPRLAAQLEPVDLTQGGLEEDGVLAGVLLSGTGGQSTTRGVELRESRLAGVDLAGSRLAHLSIQDCVVDGGNLANVTVRGGIAQRTSFDGTRLTGLSWHEGTIREVTFSGCRIDLASFAASRLERVRFEGCSLVQSDLQDARLAAVVFEDCDLSELDFSGARFAAGCELRGCTLDGARAVQRLRGVGMTVTDVIGAAGVFAATLGITILDDDEEEDE